MLKREPAIDQQKLVGYEFFELALMIMNERHVEMPETSEEAVILYSILTDDIANQF